MKYNTKKLAIDGMLCCILVILGMIKVPSVVPGAEFQISAPFAVCLAAIVGFKRYLGIGVCASIIQLLLGTHTIYNCLIAFVFRIFAGAVIAVCPSRKVSLFIAGPIGTAAARVVMAVILNVPVWGLLIAAVPGMVFTLAVVFILYGIINTIKSRLDV